MIEIKQFDGKSITPKDDALMYDLLFNGYGIFDGCSVSFLGANKLLVSSGRLIVKGRQVVITEETIAAQLSPDGTKKGRLYIHIDLSSTTTPIEFMTTVADKLPELTQEEDVNYNDGIFEIELCNYDVSETAISNIVETCPVITGGVDLLSSMEELMANTTPGKAVDALVVAELSESLTVPEDGVKYYADKKDGKYGVNTDPSRGADTFIPFSSGLEEFIYFSNWSNSYRGAQIFDASQIKSGSQSGSNYFTITLENELANVTCKGGPNALCENTIVANKDIKVIYYINTTMKTVEVSIGETLSVNTTSVSWLTGGIIIPN